MDHCSFSGIRDPKYLVHSIKERVKRRGEKDSKINSCRFWRDIHWFNDRLLSASFNGRGALPRIPYPCGDPSEVSDPFPPDRRAFQSLRHFNDAPNDEKTWDGTFEN